MPEKLTASEEMILISDYYSYLGEECWFPRDPFSLLAGMAKNRHKVAVSDDKNVHRIARRTGVKHAEFAKALNAARSFQALRCALFVLNMRGVPCFYYRRVPERQEGMDYSPLAEKRMKNKVTIQKMLADIDGYRADFDELVGQGCSKSYIEELGDIPGHIQSGHKMAFPDHTSKYVNTIGGVRVTAGQPQDYDGTVYVYGSCNVFGYFLEDGETLPSRLQSFLNEHSPRRLRVVNRGIYGGRFFHVWENFVSDVNQFHPGDVVVLMKGQFDARLEPELARCGAIFRDWVDEWNASPEASWCFYDKPIHMGRDAIERAASIVGNDLIKTGFEAVELERDWMNTDFLFRYLQEGGGYDSEVNKWLDEVIDEYPPIDGGKIGCIVMNANPFTLGHQGLVERAGSIVDQLYVFVVEEDTSSFPFEARFDMVRRGAAHLTNVVVVSSGRYLISAISFPGYFMKSTVDMQQLNVADDVNAFVKIIAPRLGITVRFVGEEPTDAVTDAYNEEMKRTLAQHGIELDVIPRKTTSNGEIISGTETRKLVRKHDEQSLAQFVPETTCEVIRELWSAGWEIPASDRLNG